MTSSLPTFTYHPDPVGTGSIEPSDQVCRCCERSRGWVYAGPVYAVEELDHELCPWCVADGSAADRFDATYTDAAVNVPADVPPQVVDELLRRTPGFAGWQQEQWLYHCADGCAFAGPVGAAELAALPAPARAAVAAVLDAEAFPEQEREEILARLDRQHGPTAYLFVCRHCGEQLAYWDCC